MRPEKWLPSWHPVDREEALALMARRYLSAYGPATKTDFARWWGAWPGVGNAAWSALKDELVTVSVGGASMQILGKDVDALRRASLDLAVQLLPGFDTYLMGYAKRDHLVDRAFASRVSRMAGWISACVLLRGEVIGAWTHVVKNGTVHITVTPFRRMGASVTAEVKKRGRMIGDALSAEKTEVRFA